MSLTPQQLHELALAEFTAWFKQNYPGPRTIISDPAWHAPKIFRSAAHRLEKAHADALEEIERLNAAWKAQQFHLEAEERESAHWQERAEQAERRAERLKFHAEAMATTLDGMAKTMLCNSADVDAYRRDYPADEKDGI